MQKLISRLIFALAGLILPIFAFAQSPNVVLIFCDDMGYGDLHCYGSKNITPNIDRLAEEGTRYTDFYAGQPICSASRAALMTGCYPNRVSIFGALSAMSKIGINEHEYLMPQMFKSRGYATGIIGKWHLGYQPQFSPIRHGFDEFFGLPYSHDMAPSTKNGKYPPLPLMDGEKVVKLNPDPGTLTTMYMQHAVSFIDRHKNEPFFLYFASSLPHVPLGVAKEHLGKSGLGLYGDVIWEIDWAVGKFMDELKKDGLDDKTLVIFTADNGPWLLYGNHAGSAGILREGKMTSFDGGLREPCIMRWPGKIAPGTTNSKILCTMDLLPTFASLTGAELPKDRTIDGRDMSKVILGDSSAQGHDVYYFYWGHDLQAVRSGKWKLHFKHQYIHITVPGKDGKPGKSVQLPLPESLFDVESDPRELVNVIDQHADVVSQLSQLAQTCREDLGDGKLQGKGVRPPGVVADANNNKGAKAELDEKFWQREISVFNPND